MVGGLYIIQHKCVVVKRRRCMSCAHGSRSEKGQTGNKWKTDDNSFQKQKERERGLERERMKYKKDRPNSVLDFDSEIRIMKISESAFPFPSDDWILLLPSTNRTQFDDRPEINRKKWSFLLRIEAIRCGWSTSRSTVVESVEFIAMNIYDIIKFNQCNYDLWNLQAVIWFSKSQPRTIGIDGAEFHRDNICIDIWDDFWMFKLISLKIKNKRNNGKFPEWWLWNLLWKFTCGNCHGNHFRESFFI